MGAGGRYSSLHPRFGICCRGATPSGRGTNALCLNFPIAVSGLISSLPTDKVRVPSIITPYFVATYPEASKLPHDETLRASERSDVAFTTVTPPCHRELNAQPEKTQSAGFRARVSRHAAVSCGLEEYNRRREMPMPPHTRRASQSIRTHALWSMREDKATHQTLQARCAQTRAQESNRERATRGTPTNHPLPTEILIALKTCPGAAPLRIYPPRG